MMPGSSGRLDLDLADHLVVAETLRAVGEAIAGLPARQRTVVELRDVHGLTSEQVCDVLGISAGNQRVLLHRGRSAVRQALERRLAGQEG
jgi:RNA polymerase sigma-70 factor (ECF subfamily)